MMVAGGVTAADVMGMADVMVEHGLDKLGYTYVGIDCGWNLRTRAANGDLQPDPKKFPDGILHVAKYVKGLGDGLLKLGIYSEHATADCCGGPGMRGFEDQDAAFYKANGIEYLKVRPHRSPAARCPSPSLATCCRMARASRSDMGTGCALVPPTKPETRGTDFTKCQASSLIVICTKTYPGKNLRSLVRF